MQDLTGETIRNAVIASLLGAVAVGVIGICIVIRRMVSSSGSVAHASLSGVGLGLITSINPLIGALILTPTAAVVMGVIVKRTRLPEDTAIGMLWATGMAIRVILAALAHNTSDLSTYLFGDILSVPSADLILMGALDVVIILSVVRFYREFLSISFDEEFSQIAGVSAAPLYFLILFLISLTVVTLLRVAGILLVIALLVIPAALSRRLAFSVPKMIMLSCPFSTLFTISGLFISLKLQLPSRAVIAILCGVTFTIFLIISHLRDRETRSVSSQLIAPEILCRSRR